MVLLIVRLFMVIVVMFLVRVSRAQCVNYIDGLTGTAFTIRETEERVSVTQLYERIIQ